MTSLSGNAEGSKRYIELFLLLAASVALWWQAIVSTLQLAFANDAYTHILLILPLSVALMYFERRQRTMPGASGRRVGAIVLAIALVVLGLTAWNLGTFFLGLASFGRHACTRVLVDR